MADEPTAPEKDAPEPERGKPDNDVAELKAALRKANKEAETNRLKLKELEDKDKSESEKLTTRVAELESQLTKSQGEVQRLSVALDKGLTKTQARRLVGESEEDLIADADDLLASFQSAGDETKPAPAKPTADLKGGGDPTGDEAVNVRDVVSSIPRGF